MKLTWKIWFMIVVLIFFLLSLLNIGASTFLFLLGLAIAAIFVLISVKSKIGKTLILIILIVSAGFLIYQQIETGLEIKSVSLDSIAYEQGLRSGQIIISVNDQKIESLTDYALIMQEEFPTTVSDYKKITIQTTEESHLLYIDRAPEIILEEISLSNIKLGLDLQGGSRALVKAENKSLNSEELADLIAITNNRLNVYGLSDLSIKSVSDGIGAGANNYMLIEIAGATPAELESLIGQQGKFEAKIANETVFEGGSDIHVERAGQFSGIESCYDTQDGQGVLCRFRFPITLSQEYAKRHAEATSKLGLDPENPEYLSEQLELYIDGTLTDALYISKDLKGQETTQISIQGSGVGSIRQDAIEDARQNMNQLQTILITGSLPYKLEIVKLDTVSPILGKKFINTILLAGLAALIAVALIVLIRYRKFRLPLALLFTSFSEVIIIIGIAAFTTKFGQGWVLDLPAIAGIIAVIGTGVDQQIIVLDESRTGHTLSIKQRLKRAAAIILGSYLTTVGAMFPLLWSGAGLLRGFAIATIIGISVGVFITRPAFADIVKKITD